MTELAWHMPSHLSTDQAQILALFLVLFQGAVRAQDRAAIAAGCMFAAQG